jgi:hypothetical protein
MNKNIILSIAVLPLFLTACATPKPPQAFHKTDDSALVIESLDMKTSKIVEPTVSGKVANDTILNAATALPKHETAVVILENYTESSIGDQFRDRGTPWFVGLRNLGYEHIVFLQGRGVTDPEGLITLAKYD